ncbi:hypothetical protein KR222_007247 [Zaprionus bogoriensis]|nr:hypothetical protein KR222_007247 [Zaprionus bogoriensis]
MVPLRILVWNANGVSTKLPEVECFVRRHSIDVLMLNETHCRGESAPKLFGYEAYTANGPSAGNSRGGAAILVKSNIVHFPLRATSTDKVQLAAIAVQTELGIINFGAVYCPPRYAWTADEYKLLLEQLHPKYIVAGDWNASHWLWGAARSDNRGRELANVVLDSEVNTLATGGPTRFPYGSRGSPSYIDFALTRGILGIHVSIRKEYCNALFLDIREAFDRVWHRGLLAKIKDALPAPFFGLLQSYLERRKFAVRFHSALSVEYPVSAGVPQGSVLGPLLYSLYSHDLPQPDASLTGSAMLATFADDAHLIKALITLTWTYAIQICGIISKGQLRVVKPRAARLASRLSWYVTSSAIETDLRLGDQINLYSSRYADRLEAHPKLLASNLAD